jgi:protein TonB
MSPASSVQRIPALDEPWRRLQWVLPSSILIWIALLIGFSFLLREGASRPLEFKPIEARIVEMPAEAGGLQGGTAPAISPALPKTARDTAVSPKRPVPVHPTKTKAEAGAPVSPYGTAPSKDEAAPPTPSSGSSGGTVGSGGAGGGGGGESTSGSFSANANIGAYALYAPTPEIPDELREEVFEAEAVAHLRVDYNGQLEVTLVKPTTNARLNRILLETLRQWRFAAAIKDGIAVDSEFDIRIPVAVR